MVDYSLYIHLPFCTRKCDYCHFFVLPDKDPLKEKLLIGLKKEWQQRSALVQEKRPTSLYFGGGTPSLFGAKRIEELLNLWPCDGEITLEANPESLTKEMIRDYKNAGINRFSIGLQSLDDALLERLSRAHSAKTAIRAVEETAKMIPNVTIDLMYDIPGQTLCSWNKTLELAVKLPIQHISLYNLTFEPQTVFYKYREKLASMLPTPEESHEMYLNATRSFEAAHFHQYEISAFSREGHQSIHNTGYWLGRPFLGLGPSAFSDWNGERARNVCHLDKYCHAVNSGTSPVDFRDKLTTGAKRREKLVLALRMTEGVTLSSHPGLEADTLESIEALIQRDLLVRTNERIKMTKLGILHYDTIASELI